MEKAVDREVGRVRVGLISGKRNGFDDQEVVLKLEYIVLDRENPIRIPFEVTEIEILKALDTEFVDRPDRVVLRWIPQ